MRYVRATAEPLDRTRRVGPPWARRTETLYQVEVWPDDPPGYWRREHWWCADDAAAERVARERLASYNAVWEADVARRARTIEIRTEETS